MLAEPPGFARSAPGSPDSLLGEERAYDLGPGKGALDTSGRWRVPRCASEAPRAACPWS